MARSCFVVTGGAGFIGSHLAEAILSRGHAVRVVDNLCQGRREWVPQGAEFIQGDVGDIEVCRKSVQGATAVFHLAAMSKAGPSFDRMEECTQKNVVGTQNILIASREKGVRKLVYAASSTYYGNGAAPQTESMPPGYLNPYGLSKYVGELYCEFFDRIYQFPTISLRFFNVYGPRQPESGPYGLVMGLFLERARKGLALEIHGSGEQRRDFVHVRDVAAALWAAWESEAHGVTLNVGSGKNHSVKELADLISRRQVHVQRRAGDAEETLADISTTQKLLRWHPSVSLEEGLMELRGESTRRMAQND